MVNIITYTQNQLNDFAKEPFNSVDSLVLSCLSYINFPKSVTNINNWTGVRIADLLLAEHFEEMFSDLYSAAESRELLYAAAASPRFRNIIVMGYNVQFDSKKEKQFAAMTFKLAGKLHYIAFRGTDLTLVGWKEDFNMAFSYPTPSQLESLNYLKKAAIHCRGQLLIGGHSKGGNLAVHASINCSSQTQKRIVRIYSHDGPGFVNSIFSSTKYKHIEKKIEKTLPQSSIVGMLLEEQENYKIVKSSRSSIWQHDPFTWEIEGNDFHYIKQLKANAQYFDKTLNTWIHSMTEKERERFVESLYKIFTTVFPDPSSSLPTNWQKKLPSIIHTAKHLDNDTKDFLHKTIKELISLGIHNFPEIFKTE